MHDQGAADLLFPRAVRSVLMRSVERGSASPGMPGGGLDLPLTCGNGGMALGGAPVPLSARTANRQ